MHTATIRLIIVRFCLLSIGSVVYVEKNAGGTISALTDSVRSLGGFVRTSLTRDVSLILMNSHHRHASDILAKLIQKIALSRYDSP